MVAWVMHASRELVSALEHAFLLSVSAVVVLELKRKVLDREDALARVAAGTVTQSLAKPDRAFKLTSDGAIVRAQFHRSHYRSLRGHNGLRLLEEWRQRLRSGIPRDISRKPIWRAIHRRLRPRGGGRFAANISFYRCGSRLSSFAAGQRW